MNKRYSTVHQYTRTVYLLYSASAFRRMHFQESIIYKSLELPVVWFFFFKYIKWDDNISLSVYKTVYVHVTQLTDTVRASNSWSAWLIPSSGSVMSPGIGTILFNSEGCSFLKRSNSCKILHNTFNLFKANWFVIS